MTKKEAIKLVKKQNRQYRNKRFKDSFPEGVLQLIIGLAVAAFMFWPMITWGTLGDSAPEWFHTFALIWFGVIGLGPIFALFVYAVIDGINDRRKEFNRQVQEELRIAKHREEEKMNRITIRFPFNASPTKKITFNCPLHIKRQYEYITAEEVQKRLKSDLQLFSLAAIFNNKKTIETENWTKKDFEAFEYAGKCFDSIVAALNYNCRWADFNLVIATCKQLLGDDIWFYENLFSREEQMWILYTKR